MSDTPLGRQRRLAFMASVAVCGCWVSNLAARQPALDIASVMTRIGERVASYYRRAESVVGIESATVQPIQWNWTADGFARTVESEVRLESEGADGSVLGARFVRNVRTVNGRTPRERDKKDRSGCTDPDTASVEPLAFLLPVHWNEYRFISVKNGSEQGRATLIVEFRSANRRSKPELIEDPRGHADCFDWSGPIATRGRVWVDASTFDVLRVERRNEGPVDVRVPSSLQRRYSLPPWIVIDRDDLTVRYKPLAFSDPDEVIVLPESLQALTVVRSNLQSTRRIDTFSSYRRFLTKGRMVKDLDAEP